MSMSRKAMILMAVMLALATAATAATAFAGTASKRNAVARQVIEAIELSSDKARAATLKPRQTRTLRVTAAMKVPARR